MTLGNHSGWLRVTALMSAALTAPGDAPLFAQQPDAGAQQPAGGDEKKLKSPDQLDSLVAPIALYPDPLLAQMLAASTYPLEIVEAQRWMKANPNLKGEDLTKAAAKQSWDASVQALVAFPAALKLMDDSIQWTTELGNAFLDQQSDVMDAVQRMRKKAKDAGKLESTKEQKVEVKTVESKQVIEIAPSNPQVIYVPSYNPTVVYGPPPVYAYPPVVYPTYSTGAVVATAAVSFGVGVMMGAFWSGCCHGGYGWGCGWGGNNVVINNNFQSRYNYTNVNGGNRTTNINNRGNGTWQHNPAHRGSVPYSSRATARQYGGSTRDASGRTERFDSSGRERASTNNRGFDRNNSGFDRGSQSRDFRSDGAGNRDRSQSGRGGGDRMGNRNIGNDGGRQGAFSGSDSRARTEAASNRGFSSSRQSSGGFGGGSGRSGGGRGGGGGRRR
jgi:hypothetical protein